MAKTAAELFIAFSPTGEEPRGSLLALGPACTHPQGGNVCLTQVHIVWLQSQSIKHRHTQSIQDSGVQGVHIELGGRRLVPGQYNRSSFCRECSSVSLPRKSTGFLGGKSCQCPLKSRPLGPNWWTLQGPLLWKLRYGSCVGHWGTDQQRLLDPSTDHAIRYHNSTHHYNADTGGHCTFSLFLAISSQSSKQYFLSNYSSFLLHCVGLSSYLDPWTLPRIFSFFVGRGNWYLLFHHLIKF